VLARESEIAPAWGCARKTPTSRKGAGYLEELVSRFGGYSTDVLSVFDVRVPSLDGRVQDFAALFQQVIRSFGRMPTEHGRCCNPIEAQEDELSLNSEDQITTG
jgi:hypothetical protein